MCKVNEATIRTVNLINSMLDNELNKIREYEEIEYTQDNTKIHCIEKSKELVEEKLINSLNEEQLKLFNDCTDLVNNWWTELCEYYFKKGIEKILTDFKFLNDYPEAKLILDDIDF